jgi:hypothetical protein
VRRIGPPLIESVSAGVTVPRIRSEGMGWEQCRVNTPRAPGVLHRAQSKHFDIVAGSHIRVMSYTALTYILVYISLTLHSIVFICVFLKNVHPPFDKKLKVKLSLCFVN